MGKTGSTFGGDFTMSSVPCHHRRSLLSAIIFSAIFIGFGVKLGDSARSRGSPFRFTMEAKRETEAVDGVENLLLSCQVSQSQGVEYVWELKGNLVENTTRRHQIGPNLSISPVRRQQDEGNFTCRATSLDGFTLVSAPTSISFIWINPQTSVHLSSPGNMNEVEPGVDVIFTCHVQGTPPLTYTWFRNGEPIVAGGSVVSERSLHLGQVGPSQSGSYACEASNAGGIASPNEPFHLIIPGPRVPRLVTGPLNVITTVGSRAEFHCNFQDDIEVQWSFINNGLILNSSRHIVYSNGTLVVEKIETSDAGMYKCLANFIKEPKIPQVYSAYLRVSYLDSLTLSSVDGPIDGLTEDGKLGVREGGRVELFCYKPNGFPIPLIYWQDPAGKRIMHQEHEATDTRDSARLLIQNIRPNQAGRYSCVAENSASSTRLTVEIVLTTEPSIQTQPRTTVIVDEGKSARLTCLFKSGDLFGVRWLRNALEIPAPIRKGEQADESTRIHQLLHQLNGSKQDQQKERNSTLVIKPTSLTDAGNYTCEIITPGFPSVHSRPAQLFVTETLKFQRRPIDRKLELGSNSKIHCKAHGHPSPVVRWLKPKKGEPVFQLPSHLIDVNGTLHFPNVALSDAGVYICVASNPQGIINSSITVDVIEPPKFLVTPRNPTDAVEGQSVLIDCQASGNPKPTIQWDKETDLNGFDHNRFHVLKNGSLYITKVLRGDMGHYGCVAGNSGGFKREEVRLVVKSSDEFVSESIDDGNLMTRTVSITLSVATGYMLLVIGLMLWCRYRQLQRKQAHLAETCKENGDCEMRETIPRGNGTPGSIVKNGRAKTQPAGCGDSVKSEETVKSSHSSVGNGRAASVTASIASHRSQVSQNSKRSVSSGYDKISYPRNQLQFVMLLGHGEFGDVFLARGKGLKENEPESLVMIKSLETREETALFNFKREIDMFYKLNHDNICRLIKLCRDVDPHYMIMEYSDWGDLKQFLLATREQSIRKVPKPPNLTMTQVVQVVKQVALGMENLSNNRFVHKDLATRNCLIASGIRIKISNPGLSKDTYSGEYHNFRNQAIPLRWLPPEAVFDDDHSTKTDVWAFAVLAWEVIHQAHIPFETQSNLTVLERLERKDKLLWNPGEMSDMVPRKLVHLMTKCWDYCPTNRPSFSTIAIELDEILREI